MIKPKFLYSIFYIILILFLFPVSSYAINYNIDTDGDGLLDTTAQYKNGVKIAPIDPEPLIPNGPLGIWQKQIQLENEGNIPTDLSGFYKYDISNNLINSYLDVNWEELRNLNYTNKIDFFINFLKSPIFTSVDAFALMFRVDTTETILHSQSNQDIYDYIMAKAKEYLPSTKYYLFRLTVEYLNIDDSFETWQKPFGYNSLYDEVFKLATNNNMRNEQFYFTDSNNTEYVLWIWRGDYLALGAGAEMGIYKKNTHADNIEHWDAVDFEIPMTLSLYNYYDQYNIEHIFSWKPKNEQWWITGFNPKHIKNDVTKQVMIGTVDFSKHTDMYTSIKEQTQQDTRLNDFVIFDDETFSMWILWYEI